MSGDLWNWLYSVADKDKTKQKCDISTSRVDENNLTLVMLGPYNNIHVFETNASQFDVTEIVRSMDTNPFRSVYFSWQNIFVVIWSFKASNEWTVVTSQSLGIKSVEVNVAEFWPQQWAQQKPRCQRPLEACWTMNYISASSVDIVELFCIQSCLKCQWIVGIFCGTYSVNKINKFMKCH